MNEWLRKLDWKEWTIAIVLSLVLFAIVLEIAEWWIGHPVIPAD